VIEPWGLKPILFEINGVGITAYGTFMFLAFAVGFGIYKLLLRQDGIRHSNAMYIALFALVGGAIGSKLPLFFMYWNQLGEASTLALILSGRTILGGLIGGTLGVMLAKRAFKIEAKMGNQIAIPVAVGMAIGRIGCLLNGCCYGKETTLPWGINFGDHILRQPTQIYEIIFDLSLAICLYLYKMKTVKTGKILPPGILFRYFLNAYLSFRFLLETIRVEKVGLLGLTDFQWLCLVSLLFINRKVVTYESIRRRKKSERNT
jgi:phosphatidylglycerol:prolipoprotein diacylglycerol transferase